MDYLLQHFLRTLDAYHISYTLTRLGYQHYELLLQDLPAELDMNLSRLEIIETHEENDALDKYGRVLKTKIIRESYPICIPVQNKDNTFGLKVDLNIEDYAIKTIEIDCAIRKFIGYNSKNIIVTTESGIR